MKKVALFAGLIGFLIALFWGVCAIYTYQYGSHGASGRAISSGVILWVWPTAAMLMDVDDNWTGILAFVIASVANGVIYAIAATAIAFLWQKAFPAETPKKENGWWPSPPRH